MSAMIDNQERTGAAEAVIDLEAAGSAEGFHLLIEEHLPVPGYYGRNLDALYDFLTSYFKPLKITFLNYDNASEKANSRFYENLRRMCDKALSENENITIYWR